MQRHTEEVISLSLILPTFSFGSPEWNSMQQRPSVDSARTAGGNGCRLMSAVRRKQRSGRQRLKPVSKMLTSLTWGPKSSFVLLRFSLDPHFTVYNPVGVAPPELCFWNRWNRFMLHMNLELLSRNRKKCDENCITLP